MKRKQTWLVICVIAVITCLTGISELAAGIAARGWDGVNYGRVVFPVLLGSIALWQYQRKG